METNRRRAAFETLEERLALDAAYGLESFALDDAASSFNAAALLDDSNAIELSNVELEPPVAKLSQEVYYVQDGGIVRVECANSPDENLRYFWKFDAPGMSGSYVEYSREIQFSLAETQLTSGEYSFWLRICDENGLFSAPVEGTLVVGNAQPSERSSPSFSVETERALDGRAVVLNIQCYNLDALSMWSIDWGDDTTTEYETLDDAIKASHCYAESREDEVYTISMIAVDAEGRVCEDIYELATVEVPSCGSVYTFLTDVFYDAEKASVRQSRICWAAGTSNVLCYTGWADSSLTRDQGGSSVCFETEDDVYEYLARNFDNTGSSAYYGYEWFITGEYEATGVAGWAQPDKGSGGFYTEVSNFTTIAKFYSYGMRQEDAKIFPEVAAKLEHGWGSTVSLAFYSGNPGSTVTLAHTVTLWGFECDLTRDPDDPRYYQAIYISDSDNDSYKGRNAPNTLTRVQIEWVPEYCQYKLTDYDSGFCWLAEFIALAPKSSVLQTQSASLAALDDAYAEFDCEASALLAELDKEDRAFWQWS